MSSVDGLNMIECKFHVFEIFGETSVSLWNWLIEITFLTVLSSVQDGPCGLFAEVTTFQRAVQGLLALSLGILIVAIVVTVVTVVAMFSKE